MTPEQAREAFRTAWEAHQQAMGALAGPQDPRFVELEAGARAVLEEAIKARKPGQRLPHAPEPLWTLASKVLGQEETERVTQPFRDQANALTEDHRARVKALKEALGDLAPRAQLRGGETPRVVQGYWASSYASTNSGHRYARCLAQIQVESLQELHGVRAEVRQTGKDYTETFEAVAYLESDLDVELAKRLPGLSLVEIVRRCWRQGCQPRVFLPYLPVGWEDSHGLDYFGGFLKPRT